MLGWTRLAEDLIVGRFAFERERGVLRTELDWLRRITDSRLRTAPRMLPFGTQVDFAVTATLPDNADLRVLLSCFCGDDQPDWVWQARELDLWAGLHAHAVTALHLVPAEAGRQVEIRSSEHVQALSMAARALAAVTTHYANNDVNHDARPKHALYAAYLWRLVDQLSTVAAVPPLPSQPGPAPVADHWT